MKYLQGMMPIALTALMLSSIIVIHADEVGEGAFFGATSGAIIGGAAGGGRGAGIGAGVGLGLGLIGGSIAKSNRRREERRYQTRALRNEEYNHQLLFHDTPVDLDEDDEYIDDEVKAPVATSKQAKYKAKKGKVVVSSDEDEKTTSNNATVDTASEDEEYTEQEVMPDSDVETSYEDEV